MISDDIPIGLLEDDRPGHLVVEDRFCNSKIFVQASADISIDREIGMTPPYKQIGQQWLFHANQGISKCSRTAELLSCHLPKERQKKNVRKKKEMHKSHLILTHMTGQVPASVIQVYESPVDIGDGLDNVLKTLAEIVAVAETRAFVEDDVDFDVQLIAAVVGLQALDGFDGLGESHGEVE